MRMLVASVFLNEEQYLPTFLDSLAGQSRLPDAALLVDDGSSDRSAEIAEEFALQHPWAKVVRRPVRPPDRDRLASASVWTSFRFAVDAAMPEDGYDVVAKVDADLRLSPRLLEDVEKRFIKETRLGLTGPYLSEVDAKGASRRLRWRAEHVGGATKFYRRECYLDVYPLPPLLNLDMVDELKARNAGWTTASFAATGGDPVHLRPHGTHDGALRGFRRWGRGDYVSGSHPLLVLFVGVQRLREYPPVLGSLNYFAGWLAAALQGVPRFDPPLRALRRQEQMARVRERLGRLPGPFRAASVRQERARPERGPR